MQSNWIEGVYDRQSLHDAVDAWLYLVRQQELTGNIVRSVHNVLMLNHLPPIERGAFRTVDVFIGGNKALNPILIPSAMREWLRGQNCTDWQQWHVEYEKVHPFIDGNGRTGRMFMNWHRLKLGLPILVIAENARREYYSWFT